MARLRQNFQSGELSAGLTIGGLTLNSAELAAFQAVSGSDYAVIVLDPQGVDGAPEIVHVTAHTALATTATITRAQEGTVARAHNAGTDWEHNITEDDFDYNNLANLPTVTDKTLKSITYIATGTTTYTLPAGITTIWVQCIGAGAGGGGCATAAGAGGGWGGRAGGYAEKLITSPASSYTVAVGAGGAGGTAGANAGSNGGATTFGSPSVCTAAGGTGGPGRTAGGATIDGDIASAIGTVGDLLMRGTPATGQIVISATVARSGRGGSAPRGGGGGLARNDHGTGWPGEFPGGGGGGGACINNGGAVAGGAGANGSIIVFEFGV